MPQTEVNISGQNRGIINQVTAWFTNLFARAKTYIISFGTREVLSSMDANKAICEGYEASAAYFSIIEADADKFASIPRYLVDPKAISEKHKKRLPAQFKDLVTSKVINNDLNKLMNRPNPYEGQAAFLKKARTYYKVTGEAFIWLNRGDIEGLTDQKIDLLPVIEMYVLPSDKVRIVPDPENLWGVLGYILEVGGQILPIRKGDIIHWKKTNLHFDASSREHLRGMPELKPGAATLQQNKDATLSSVRQYQNDGAKGALANKSNVKLTVEQQGDVRSVIDRKINNNDVKGAVAALNGDWVYLDLGKSSVDLQLLEGKQWTWKELCALSGVPYQLFDPSVTYANLEFAQKNWVTNKQIPACKEFDDELNRLLLRAFALEGKAIIQSDFSQLPELQEDLGKMAAWLLQAWWITPNEKREMMGYEEINEPTFDEPWVPAGTSPLSVVNAGDNFDQMMNDLGLQDYGKTPDPQKNGKTNGVPVNN